MNTLWRVVRGVLWRLRAMIRLWSPSAESGMSFLAPEPVEIPEEELELEPEPVVANGLIDLPKPDKTLEGETITVAGWVVFESGEATSRVEVWLGEDSLGRARLGVPRTDVAEVNEAPYAGISGFELTTAIDAAQEETEVRVVATARDGETFELEPVPISIARSRSKSKAVTTPRPVPAPAARGERGLRVMVVTHQLNLGGAQLYLLDLLRGLLDHGSVEPVVISSTDGPLREELEEMGIPVHLTSLAPTQELATHLGRIEELAAWAAPFEFDVALINTATSVAFPGAEIAARLGIAAVWAIHESFVPSMLWADLKPPVRRHAESVLSGAAMAVFEASATQRIFEPLVDASRCITLPYGVDFGPIERERAGFDRAAVRRELGVPVDAEVLLCVGTVEPRKAQVALAQAFDLIADRHPDAYLAFVGGRELDPNSIALEDFIETARSGERIELVPITPDVQPWYGLSDFLVCASDIESLPRTVLEAMGWGTPVLATSVFGLPELIADGETGWLCEPRDMSALADALDRALGTTPEQRREIGEAARALVEERHSLAGYGEKMAELLEWAAAGDDSPPPRHVAAA